MVDGLRQELSKLLIVEYLQIATGGYFADGGWMPVEVLIAVWTLNKDGTVTEAFGEHLTSDVVQPDTPTDVSSCQLHLLCSVDVGKQSETESVTARRVSEAVDDEGWLWGVERFSDPCVQLVVRHTAPIVRLQVLDWLHVVHVIVDLLQF